MADRIEREENVAHEKKVENAERYVYCGYSAANCIIVRCSVYADTDNSQCCGQSDVAEDYFL